MSEKSYEMENALIEHIDDQKLAALFLPAIKEVIRAGGGADAILKKSEALAATKLSTSVLSDKPDVALRASIEILNRIQGKPVERHLNIYADVAQMSESQLDQEIIALAKRAGTQNIIDAVVSTAKTIKPRAKKAPAVIKPE